MGIKPWKKIGDPETLFEVNKEKRMILQRFEDPHTQQIKDYTQLVTTRFASIVLALTEQREVLAVRQYRHAADQVLVELPGGNPKTPEQSPEETALDELFEETLGYKPKAIIKLNSDLLWINPALFKTPFHAFLALDCFQTKERPHQEEGEYVELVKIPLCQWLSMCVRGEIADSKSLAVTILALNKLGITLYDKTPN